MADNTEFLNQISEGSDIIGKFENAIGNLSSVIDRLTRRVEGGKGGFELFSEGVKKAKQATDGIIDSTKNAVNSSSTLTKSFQGLTSNIFKAISANKELANVGIETLLSVEMLSKGTIGLGDSLKDFDTISNQTNKTSAKFAETMGILLPDSVAKAMKNFNSAVNQVKAFENSIMSAAQTGGNFYQVYYKGGDSIVEQNQTVMNKVAKQAFDTGNILGMHFEDANKLILDVMKDLPGEFGKIYDKITIGTEQYSLTTEQIIGKATRGIGISTEKGLTIAKEMLYKFGEDAIGAAERMAVLSKASKDIGVPFADLSELSKSLDSTFSMWGDQLEGMVPILNDVSKALEGTNVGIEGQMTLIKNLGSAVEKMNLPMKSFIGTMSGMRSAGGAVGVGLNIERMLQEGRTGEIISMMQETMQKMSGRRAVTLEQATEDPRAQRAFMVQRGLIQQMTGAGTGEANRLLEVMSKVELGTGNSVDAQNALSEAMQDGQDIASKQTDIMAMASENMKALNSTLIATNKLYTQYVETFTAKGRGKDIMETSFAKEAEGGQQEKKQIGLTFAKDDLSGERIKNLMEKLSVDMVKSFSSGFAGQLELGQELVAGSLEDLSSALKSTSNESLTGFAKVLDTVTTNTLTSFGNALNKVKDTVDKDFGFESTKQMPEIEIPEPKIERFEPKMEFHESKKEPFEPVKEMEMPEPKIQKFEPLELRLDVHMINEDGDTVENKLFKIATAVLNKSIGEQ